MADNKTEPAAESQPPKPNPGLKQLEVLVGTWTLEGRDLGSGAAMHGQLTFEWLDGGFFLVQRATVEETTGIEYIGYDEVRKACTSHYFDNVGNLFNYTFEIEGDRITVTGVDFDTGISTTKFDKSAGTAAFNGTFSADRKTITGRWEWPGGGYDATITKSA